MEKKLGHAHADGYDRRACDGCGSGDITLCNHDRGGLWNNSNDSNIWDCIFTQSVVDPSGEGSGRIFCIYDVYGYVTANGTGGTGRLSVVGHYLYWHKNSDIPSIICPENSVKYPA